MRKSLLFATIVALIMLLGINSVKAAPPHRLVYGYFLNYGNSATYGWARFYMNDTNNPEFFDEGDGVKGVFCGACAYGTIYYCEYEYSLTEGPLPSGLWAYDISTGRKTLIGNYSDETVNPTLKFIDMTYDYSTDTMYALGFEMGVTSLYTIDLTTGKSTKVVNLDNFVSTLACDINGKLYGIHQDGVLRSIDKETGKCTDVFKTGYIGMLNSQSIEFDHTTGKLYWASNVMTPEERKGTTYLVSIDLSGDTPVMEDVAYFDCECTLLALYIPFVKAGEKAPTAPSDITITAGANGAANATITWTNPSQTFAEEALTDLKSITIKRGDKTIATIPTTEAGKSMSYEDTDVPDGYYRYTLYATNETGDGEEDYGYAYVGRDCPEAPANVTVHPGEGCQSAVLSWEKPQAGYHGGYFTDEALTYRIVRYPDEAEVAKDLTDNTFTDNTIRRLGRYYYKVYACNPYGETAETTDAGVLGKAIDVDGEDGFVEDFSDQTRFDNQWTNVDGNADYYSWTFNTMAPQYQFRSSSPGAEYFINPGTPNLGNDADEWLISPPLSFTAGQKYAVTFSARTMSEESVVITCGTTNETSVQNEIEALTVSNEYSLDSTDPVPFTDYTIDLPEVTEDYIGCIGLHIVTPYPATGFSFFHMTSIAVKNVTTSGIETLPALTTGNGVIYNLNGQIVGTRGSRLPKGVYIRDGKKIIIK